jgi:hypothetical protein
MPETIAGKTPMPTMHVTPEMTSEYVRWTRRVREPLEHLFHRATSGDKLSEDERVALYAYLIIDGFEGRDPETVHSVLEMLRPPAVIAA